MYEDEAVVAAAEVSEEFQSFEEFCEENAGHELTYLELVRKSPLDMDSVTLAFCMRHLVRLSREMMDVLLGSLQTEEVPELHDLLAVKGIQLDKTRGEVLREIVFSFRDCADDEIRNRLSRAFQLMTIGRERRKVRLTLGEAYAPPSDGWTLEDFGGDDSLLDTVRAIEDPLWTKTEEY